MEQDFDNLHVVVTGGTGALGGAVVELLLSRGATCHVPALDRQEAEAFRQRSPVAGHERLHLSEPVDLRDEASVQAFYRGLDPLWASVHCAGGFAMSALEQTSLEDFRQQLDMNLVTCFLCCREAAARMPQGGGLVGGRLVNVAARPALEPRTGSQMAAYTASKAGVAALSQALGEELAMQGIWVNAVAPSIMDTPANRTAMPDAPHDQWPSVLSVAQTIAFLASPQNGTTRSAVVPVYGAS